MRNGLEIDGFGSKFYWKNNQFHREDGPAIEIPDGSKWWYQDDKLHRLDGPAVIYSNGIKEWWYKGHSIDCQCQEEFERIIKLKTFW